MNDEYGRANQSNKDLYESSWTKSKSDENQDFTKSVKAASTDSMGLAKILANFKPNSMYGKVQEMLSIGVKKEIIIKALKEKGNNGKPLIFPYVQFDILDKMK